MRVREAQSRWVLLAHCARSAWKKGEGVLMPMFRLSMRGLACSLETVLNSLCRFRNEGFACCLCLFVFVYSSEGWKEALPLFESVMATVGRMFFGLSMCARGKRELSFA